MARDLLVPNDKLLPDIFAYAQRIANEGPAAVVFDKDKLPGKDDAELLAFAATLEAPDHFLIDAAKLNLIELMTRDCTSHMAVARLVETLMNWHIQLHRDGSDDIPEGFEDDPLLTHWMKYKEQYETYKQTMSAIAEL